MARKDPKKASKVRPAAERRDEPETRPLERHAFWWAMGGLAFLLLVFFHQVFLGGKTFQPPDTLASLALQPFVKEAFHGPGSLLARYPLWTPYIFSGMPSYGSMISAPYVNVTSMLLFLVSGSVKIIAYYFLIGVFTWLLLRRKGVGTLPALLAVVGFVFCTHVITWIMFGHNTKVGTAVYLPLVLLATDALWERPGLRWASILALAVGLMLLSFHLQIAYYTFLAAGLYMVTVTVIAIRRKRGAGPIAGRWVLWGAALAVGLVASSVLFLSVHEYAAHSIRGGTAGGLTYGYATNWSLHPLEITTFFVPSFLGYGGGTYWGWMPFTDFPHYMGILPFFLAVLTLVLWPRERLHVYFLVLGGFSLLVAFGKHLPLVYNLLFHYLPYFNKFRVPSMILVLVQFSVAVLAALGLERLARTAPAAETARRLKRFWIVAAIFAGIVILLGIYTAGGLEQTAARRIAQRAPGLGVPAGQAAAFGAREARDVVHMAGRDVFLALFFLVLGLGLIWARLKRRIPAVALTAGIIVITVIDLWRVDVKPATYYPRGRQPAAFDATGAVKYLEQDSEPFRILPLVGGGQANNSFAYFLIPSIVGYHPAKLQIYQDLIDDQGPAGISKSLGQGNFNIIDMLNTKYVVSDREIAAGPLKTVYRGQQFVMENTSALPRMWFVDRARVIADPEAHLQAVANPGWRPAEEALLFTDPGPLDPGTGGTARVTEYHDREIHADLDSPGNSLLVMSEIYYEPGWNATLDGKPVEIRRADYVLRAIKVPPGHHALVMRFDPPSFRRGVILSIAAFAFILIGLALSFVFGRGKGPAEPAAPAAGEA